MDKNIWVTHISDYRKWQARLYIELYKADEYYTTVYYDIRNNSWGFKDKKNKDKFDVDFGKIQEIVREELLKEFKSYSYPRLNPTSYYEEDFQKLADAQGYNIYCTHKKFKTEYQKNIILREKKEEQESERLRKECWCECGSSLFYTEIVRKTRKLDKFNRLEDLVIENIPENIIEPYFECHHCNSKYEIIRKKDKFYRGEKIP